MKATLTKVKSNHHIADGSFKGMYVVGPTVGDRFVFYTDPTSVIGRSSIITTAVNEVTDTPEGFMFNTKNSTYMLVLQKE